MKQFFLSIFLTVSISITVKCQITQHSWMLGGNISFASTNYKSANYGSEHTYYNFQINPTAGYFVKDKFAIGLRNAITLSGNKQTGTDIYSKYNDFNLGPFLRYYFLSTENVINLFADGCYQYGLEGDKNQNTSKNTLSVSAGAVTFFNSSVGIEFQVSYSTYKFSGINGSNGTIQLGLGLQVHLEK